MGMARAAVAGDVLVEDTQQKLTVRQISTGRKVRDLDQSEHAYGDPFWLSDDGTRLVAFNLRRQEFNVWDVGTGKLAHTKLPKTDRWVEEVFAISADGMEVYAVLAGIKDENGYRDLPRDGVYAVRLDTGAVERRVEHPTEYGRAHRWPVTADRRVFIDDRAWDLRTGKEYGPYPWDQLDAVSPDGRYAAAVVGPFVGTVALWDVPAKRRLGYLPRLEVDTGFGKLTFSPDGTLLAVGGRRHWHWSWTQGMDRYTTYFEDRVLLLYEVGTRKRIRTLAFPVYPPDSKDVPNPEIP